MTTVHMLRGGLKLLAIPLLVLPLTAGAQTVRILQSNAAGDRQHIIDPATNKVVGEFLGTEACHGITATPDGSKFFCSNEVENTLDVNDGKSYKLLKRIPLSGRPNNIAIAKDGRKVYVGIRQAVGNNPGVVDVIDTNTLTNVKSIRTEGPIHNVYVTPDGKFAYAGSPNGSVSVLDLQTEAPAWHLQYSHIRPMTADTYPDGSTRNLYIQAGDANGFVVVDFKTRKELKRVALPNIEPGRVPIALGSGESHGIFASADSKILVVCSRLNNALYSYSLPDLKLLGTAHLSGRGAAWVTLTPDGRRAYVADPVGNNTLVVDVPTMKEIAKIKVGQVPKRNHTMVVSSTQKPTQD